MNARPSTQRNAIAWLICIVAIGIFTGCGDSSSTVILPTEDFVPNEQEIENREKVEEMRGQWDREEQ